MRGICSTLLRVLTVHLLFVPSLTLGALGWGLALGWGQGLGLHLGWVEFVFKS